MTDTLRPLAASDLRALAYARGRYERTLDTPAGPRRFALRIPSAHELEVAALLVRGDWGTRRINERAFSLALFRRLLDVALVDWTDVTGAEILPAAAQPLATDDAAEAAERAARAALPVPFDAGLVTLYLDAQPAVATELAAELAERYAEARAPVQAAKKN